MDPDTLRAQDIITSVVGGLNWYLIGHEHKLQFDYGVVTMHLSAVDTGSSATTLIEKPSAAAIHDCLLRTRQLQVTFLRIDIAQ